MSELENKYSEALLVPNPMTPNVAIIFHEDKCIGCNKCIDYCRVDALMPNPIKGKPPILLYPDECWFAGCCAGACPHPGAIEMVQPINQRVGWKRKETGEYFRVGMDEHPEPCDLFYA